jgi:sugar lactone lactonase YvrE
MFARHTCMTLLFRTAPTRVMSIIPTLILCTALLTACNSASAPQATQATPTIQAPSPTKSIPTPTAIPPTPTHAATPERYTARTLLQGVGRPDDLAFDKNGRLLFSDAHNGTISRLNTDGSVTVLVSGLAAPEGIVVLPDGTMIIAEQGPNRILALAPGASSPRVLRQLPGTPSSASCKDGVDGLAFDPRTNSIIVPDSPIGTVYSMSLDGKTLTLLASGITRPVGAAVDATGNIYLADECGGALWHLSPSGKLTRIGGFGMLDDVVIDAAGNILVTDLEPQIHALIRYNPTTGARTTLASRGYIEPQGLEIDARGNIFVSDDYANIIVEYSPA